MADDTKLLLWLLLLSSLSLCFGSELDIKCLSTVKQSVIDTSGTLASSWNFANSTNGYICRFTGVECWHPDENRVLSLRLSNLGLQGPFPDGLQHCTNMSGLDLSSNNFSGPIPSDIGRKVPYLTSLDLSYNSFSGEIPESITNMAYLNVLKLQHNQLRGQIPEQFDSNFVGNLGLCGRPLDECSTSRINGITDESCIGVAVGFVTGFVVALYFPYCFVFSKRLHPYVFRI